MQQISTPELLVKHLYNETNIEEQTLVKNALENDKALHQEFAQMQTAKNALDDTGGNEPRKSIIDNILNYSKQTAIEMV